MGEMRLVVVGAGGRMGRSLVRSVCQMEGVLVSAAVDRENSPFLGQDIGELSEIGPIGVKVEADAEQAFAEADGVLDFTSPAASLAYAKLAAAHGLVHVIGTTGMSADQTDAVATAAQKTPIVKSGNMSLGVNLLANLVRKAAAALDEDFDIEIVEMHHRHKVDAPSGTALLLGEAAAAGRGVQLEDRSVRVRDGHTGPRPEGDIGFATLRGGSVIGDHDVIFAGPFERITLAHHAQDRQIFARGAIKAALWARNKKPGLYSMADVLGLSD